MQLPLIKVANNFKEIKDELQDLPSSAVRAR